MEYIVIVKTYKDETARNEDTAHLPDYFPLLCEEFPEWQDAKDKYPDLEPMTIEEYKGYIKALKLAHPKPETTEDSIWNKIWPF